MFQFAKKCLQKSKLVILYFRRIIFVRGHFHVSPIAKIRSNIGGGFLTDQYMLYGLKDASRKKEYLSEFDWYRSRYINSPYDFLLNNKVACTQLLQQYVRVPEIYAMRNKGIISAFGQDVMTEDDVLSLIRDHGDAFFKPSDKGKGNGVCHISERGGQLYIDDRTSDVQEIRDMFSRYENWILCETIQQGKFPASLYDRTVNTIRMITFRNVKSEKFEVFFAVQRIGTRATIPVRRSKGHGCRDGRI